jgi:hypothetical protein
MTLSEIARRIEALRPGTLPPHLWPGTPSELWTWCAHDRSIEIALHDDIARLTLIGAMVMAVSETRHLRRMIGDVFAWQLGSDYRCTIHFDRDHANDPLLSLLAAFEAVHATNNAPQAQKD